jgi:hypothetical protein
MGDLQGLLDRLIEHGVDFVVIGGYAAVAHGSPMMTVDVDICCDMSPANLLRLQGAIDDLHPVHRMVPERRPLALTKRSCEGLRNLYLDTDWGQLDCLGEVTGLGGYDAVKPQSILVDLESGACRILSLAALIKAKEAMGEPKDQQAVAYLKAILAKRPSRGQLNRDG